jgi:hypothetical protein
MKRKDEKPPENHWKKRFPELEKEFIDTYYKFKGWDNDGVPTKESLHELDLDYVSEDFERRGIYSENTKRDNPVFSSQDKSVLGSDLNVQQN